MVPQGFENVKGQIGFCGIWCGSCPAGNQAVIELTRKYEEIVKKQNLEKWAPKGFDFKEFTKGLALIQTMSTCPGCRKGGGAPNCKVRICALGKGFTNCSQCTDLIPCKNFEELEKSNPRIKEGLLQIKNVGQEAMIDGWMKELRTKWPHCILFCGSSSQR